MIVDKSIFKSEIETTLICCFFPTFFGSELTDDYLHIIISTPSFNSLTVDQRVSIVYQKLLFHDRELLEQFPVVVETYSTKEIEDLIDYVL